MLPVFLAHSTSVFMRNTCWYWRLECCNELGEGKLEGVVYGNPQEMYVGGGGCSSRGETGELGLG